MKQEPVKIEIPPHTKRKMAIYALCFSVITFMLTLIFTERSQDYYDIYHLSFGYDDYYDPFISIKRLAFLGVLNLFCACVIGVFAIDEKEYKISTFYYFVFFINIIVSFQLFRITFHEGLFYGLASTIIKWTFLALIFCAIKFFVNYKRNMNLLKKELAQIESDRVIKTKDGYLVTMDDGSIVNVTKEELYQSTHK